MSRPAFHELRFWLLLAALALVVAGLLLPRVKLTREAYDAIAFIDITASMNTRDVTINGQAVSRLDLIKNRLGGFVERLPCQSKLGLGLFTERRVVVLFEPVEVCANFADIEASINALDWRMAWAGDSHVARGVHRAFTVAANLGVDLLFFTDGHEAPPLPWTGLPDFEGEVGEVHGLVVGVGGKSLVPLAKFDEEGRQVGVLSAEEVLQENRSGLPPPDAVSRPGYHPRQSPFGTEHIDNNEHLTSVKEEHLQALASQVGLAYAHLGSAAQLLSDYEAVASPRAVTVSADIRPYPGWVALFLLAILYGVLPLRTYLAGRQARPQQFRRAPSGKITTKEAYS